MKKGFMLLEMIIYISIFIIFIIGLFSLISNIVIFRVNYQEIVEVNNQGIEIVSIITQNIRNGSSLEIIDNNLIVDNVTFFEDSGVFYIKEELSNSIPLSNDRVYISNLVFSDLSYGEYPKTIKFSFDLNSLNSNFDNQFYGTANLRKYE